MYRIKHESIPQETSVFLTLDEQLEKAQAEHDAAILKLHDLESDFSLKAVEATADQFQKLEAEVRQQRLITASKNQLVEELGQRVFEERQAADEKQAAAVRAGRRTLLMAKLDAVHGEMRQLEDMKRVPIDHRLQILNSERSAILMELSTLKEHNDAA
jgi:hypothetical protein